MHFEFENDKKSRLKAAFFGHTEISAKYISKASNHRQTQPKWNLLGRSDNESGHNAVIELKLVSICMCGLSKTSILFAGKLDYLQSMCDVTKVSTYAWRYCIFYVCDIFNKIWTPTENVQEILSKLYTQCLLSKLYTQCPCLRHSRFHRMKSCEHYDIIIVIWKL